MRICVYGTGAVGGYFGGRLAEAGEPVVFVARGETLAALRRRGLRISTAAGDLQLPAVEATDRPAEIGPVDVVILGVKAWQVSDAAEAIRPLVGEGTAILPLQNGVEAADQLAAVFGEAHVLGGMCRIIAKLEAPGRIRHVGVDPFIALGELNNVRSDRVERLTAALEDAGVEATISPDIRSSIWQKFLFFAPASCLGAVARVPLGEVRANPETRRLLMEGMREVEAVAAGLGVSLREDVVDRSLGFLDGMPAEGTPSLQRDIAAGRPSELEATAGAMVRLGREAGISTPVHRFLYAVLSPLEARARTVPRVPS